jgi:hypothetical protein
LVAVAGLTRPVFEPAMPQGWENGARELAERRGREPAAAIAYAGNNLPYLFRMERAQPVLHVPPDGRLAVRFDQRAVEWRRAGLEAAISPSPGFDRRIQDASAWLAGLREAGVGHVVTTRMAEQQPVQVRHDPAGFPIEDSWARDAAPALEPVFADLHVRIYQLHSEREPRAALPAASERREPDAFALLTRRRELERLYPLGAREIRHPRFARMRARAERLPRRP